MPAHADHVLRHGHAEAQARHLHQLAEFHVFDDVHAQPAVSSAFFIGGPAHELEGPDSHVASGAWIRSQPRFVAEDEPEPEIGNRRNLPESAHLNGGEKRQVVPLALLGKRDGAPQHVGRKMHVRIGKNQPFALRLFEARNQRVRFSEPARRQTRNIDDFQIRFRAFEIVEDRGSLVLGAVVDRDDFKPGIILGQERLEGAGELLRLVPRGKNHGNQRRIGRGQAQEHRKATAGGPCQCRLVFPESPTGTQSGRTAQSRRCAKLNFPRDRIFCTVKIAEHCMLTQQMSETLSIVGAGRVGKALGRCLHDLGWGIGFVATRSIPTARAAVRAIGAGTSGGPAYASGARLQSRVDGHAR